ncbi:MAG: aldehyde dehydrogenase family protein [Lacibacter sp.]
MNQYQPIYDAQRAFFKTGATRSRSFRKEQLQKLEAVFRSNEKLIEEALYKDLRKHPQEVYMTEMGAVYEEISYLKKHFSKWMQPVKVPSSLFLFPASSVIYPEPLGIVLVISPWNYPMLLTWRGVAGAIAAGNTVIVKPSELSQHASAVMAKLINENFAPEFLHVIEGDGATVVPALLEHFHFDHVMFTGSTANGKKVMEMAAKHLSPVTLELGGKSPCIVAPDANIKIAAKRIVWGKMISCGQSCVAPDYLIVHESVKEEIVQALISEFQKGYGDNPQHHPSYPRLINNRRFESVVKYLTEGTIVYGGDTDAADKYIAPTILENVNPRASVMHEEIFGPVLPVFTYRELSEASELIEKNPYPLALYVFTNNSKTEKYFIEHIRFGGGGINETILHLGNSELPFGGVGYSGHGGYLGKHSFDTFTNYKGVVKRATWFEPAFRHAPFSHKKTNLWRYLLGRK